MWSRFLKSNQCNFLGCGPTNALRLCVSKLFMQCVHYNLGDGIFWVVASYKAKASNMRACILLNPQSFTSGINIGNNNFKLLLILIVEEVWEAMWLISQTLGLDCLGSDPQRCHWLAVWPWGNYLTDLCHSFLIYKMSIIKSILLGCYESWIH